MKPKRLYILHENGAPRHFEALFFLNKNKNYYDEIISLEFTFIRQFVKGIVRKNGGLIKKSLYNFIMILNFLFTKDKHIIIGAAPYDVFAFYLALIKKRHQLIYYSSWPYWDFSRYPKKTIIPGQLKAWKSFLDDIQAVGVTHHVRDGLQQYTSKTTVIPHCINEQIFTKNRHERNGKFRAIYVGRLIPEKGISEMLEFANELRGNDDVELWFVGDGVLKDKVIQAQNQNSNVKYLGKINDQRKLAEIYNQCDVLLLPSLTSSNWEELFGIVLIEAMACGVVPISTDSIGPKTIINDGLDGFIVPMSQLQQMKEKLLYLYNNRSRFEEMSINAQRNVEERYTITNTSQLWDHVINDLTKREIRKPELNVV